MIYERKRITRESIPIALEKAAHYRLLNQPDQAESIARDVLEVAPDHKGALRELGLSLTDQFALMPERFREAEQVFWRLGDAYETPYFLGLAHERLCRAQLNTGAPAETLAGLIEEALLYYAEAERHRPYGNDEAILRWNSLIRLIERYPHLRPEHQSEEREVLGFGDGPPV